MSNGDIIRAGLKDPAKYTRLFSIMNEQTGQVAPIPLTPNQTTVLSALREHPRVVVNKYRQSYMTTAGVLWLLGECQWNPGWQGFLIADTSETSAEGFMRAKHAYETMDKRLRIRSKLASQRHLQFQHGGGLRCLTSGSKDPAIGRSIDRLVITELGMWANAAAAMQKISPAYRKRPHSKVLIESTPGPAGCYYEDFWLAALEGNGWHPIFLKWWDDPTCMSPPPKGWKPDQAELAYMNDHPSMTLGHVYFRRSLLDGEYLGDTRLFDNQYPPNEYDGFTSAGSPAIPLDAIRDMLTRAVAEPEVDHETGLRIIAEPMEHLRYGIFADPAGFGAKGDPSALTIMDICNREEVAVWEGRIDPGMFADLIGVAQQFYHAEMVVIESNAAACIQSAKDKGVQNLYWTSKQHPGWYATHSRKMQALAKLVGLLREGDIIIHTRRTLHQLMSFDSFEGAKDHHYDRAITMLIVADMLSGTTYLPRIHEVQNNVGVKASEVKSWLKRQKRNARN